ncbi:hypothetical protein [Mitsuokella multacida]|uniref:hypothetical protein n=1 Tax=Mitsuokella multacida TaxID=52226 RepID=UPI00241EB8AF|nr:hypothetical protein [Mitsuokella multacida]
MFRVTESGRILLTRGDTAYINVVTDDYTPQDGDQIKLTVKRSTADKDTLIQKTVSDGVVKIEPKDTETLDYGTYVYDCQLTTAAGDVYTFIPPTDFVLQEEVTY